MIANEINDELYKLANYKLNKKTSSLKVDILYFEFIPIII